MEIKINKNRVRKDVKVGDLLAKTKNGWYYPATGTKKDKCWYLSKYGCICIKNENNLRNSIRK